MTNCQTIFDVGEHQLKDERYSSVSRCEIKILTQCLHGFVNSEGSITLTLYVYVYVYVCVCVCVRACVYVYVYVYVGADPTLHEILDSFILPLQTI